MAEFFQQVANGTSLGSIYALVAVGLTLIFGIARVGNFAHGDFVMVGAYVLILAIGGGTPWPLAAVTVILGAVALAVGIERVVFRRLYGAPSTTPFVAAVGISIAIQAAIIILLAATPRNMPPAFAMPPVWLGDVVLSGNRVLAIVGSLAALAALGVFLRMGRLGKAVRAVAQNAEAAQMVGIPLDRIRVVTMVVAGALAGCAAILITPILGATPTMGVLLTLKGFAIVITGGLGSVRGALAGAYLLGVSEALFAGFVSHDYQHAIAFVILAIVLLLRPGGLFGEGTLAMELRR